MKDIEDPYISNRAFWSVVGTISTAVAGAIVYHNLPALIEFFAPRVY